MKCPGRSNDTVFFLEGIRFYITLLGLMLMEHYKIQRIFTQRQVFLIQ